MPYSWSWISITKLPSFLNWRYHHKCFQGLQQDLHIVPNMANITSNCLYFWTQRNPDKNAWNRGNCLKTYILDCQIPEMPVSIVNKSWYGWKYPEHFILPIRLYRTICAKFPEIQNFPEHWHLCIPTCLLPSAFFIVNTKLFVHFGLFQSPNRWYHRCRPGALRHCWRRCRPRDNWMRCHGGCNHGHLRSVGLLWLLWL